LLLLSDRDEVCSLDGGAALRNCCAPSASSEKTLRKISPRSPGFPVAFGWHGLCVCFELVNKQIGSNVVMLPASIEKTVWCSVIGVVCFTVLLAVVLL
jgi:hypothetical protein